MKELALRRIGRAVVLALAVAALALFVWALGGVVSGGPETRPVAHDQAGAPSSEELAQIGTDTPAPEAENRDVESYSAYRSKDPFRQIVEQAQAEETTGDDASGTPEESADAPRGTGGGGTGAGGRGRGAGDGSGGRGGGAGTGTGGDRSGGGFNGGGGSGGGGFGGGGFGGGSGGAGGGRDDGRGPGGAGGGSAAGDQYDGRDAGRGRGGAPKGPDRGDGLPPTGGIPYSDWR